MRWNPEVSAGTVLTLIGLFVTLGIMAYKHAVDMALLARGHKDLADDVTAIKGEVKFISLIQQRLADGKERMDDMEMRLRAVEATPAKAGRRSTDPEVLT